MREAANQVIRYGYNEAIKELTIQVRAPKREWVGLTDEEIMEMMNYGQYGRIPEYVRNFVDAIESKLKEKNT